MKAYQKIISDNSYLWNENLKMIIYGATSGSFWTQHWKSQLTGGKCALWYKWHLDKNKQVEIQLGKRTDVPRTSFADCLKYNTLFNEHTCINISGDKRKMWWLLTPTPPPPFVWHPGSFIVCLFFSPDLHLWTGNKRRTCYSKQIYCGADTSRHVTHRWKPRDAINYLHH